MNEWQGPGRPETIAFVDNLKSGDRYSVGEKNANGGGFSRHPPDDGLVEAEIAGFDRF